MLPKNLVFASVFILPVLLASGCSQNNGGPYAGHKVDWYKTHAKQDDAELKWCENDVERMKNIDSCMNANQGQSERYNSSKWMMDHLNKNLE
jgi:hypothetical protein